MVNTIYYAFVHFISGTRSTMNETFYRISQSHLCLAVFQESPIPVVLVENSGRCNKNELDEKVSYFFCCTFSLYVHLYCVCWPVVLEWQILPNGIAWIPNLVETITEVVLSGGKSILVDKKLIEGPNPNERGKIFIPLILAFQVSPLRFFMRAFHSS